MPYFSFANNERIYYEVSGTGPTVLLIPPAVSDHNVYFQIVQALIRGSITPKESAEKTYKVIVYDHPGFGQSDSSSTTLTVQDLAMRAVALLNHLEESEAHIAGLSLGSAVAQELAISHPTLTRSLFLPCTWAKSDDWIVRVARLHQILADNFSFREYLEATLPYLASREFNNTPQRTHLYINSVCHNAPSSAQVVAQWQTVVSHDALDRLYKISCPALVAAGESDLMLPPEYAKEVCEAISGSRLHLFTGPHSSHLLMAEMLRDFIGLYLEFLS